MLVGKCTQYIVVFCSFLVPFIRDAHFYLTHRLLHWGPLYRISHKVHHRNTNTGAWSGLSMHPIEHILYFSGVLIHWIIPSHPLVAMYHVFHAGLAPTPGHTGYEKMTLKMVHHFQQEIITIMCIINILNAIIQGQH